MPLDDEGSTLLVFPVVWIWLTCLSGPIVGDTERDDEVEIDNDDDENVETLLIVNRRLAWITAICIRVTKINEKTNNSNKMEGKRRKNLLMVRRSKGFTGGTGIGIRWNWRFDDETILMFTVVITREY